MKISLPAALGAFVDMIQVLIDLIMVGSLEVAATAAVGIALQFMGLFYTFMGIFFVGANALISRFLGGKNIIEAERTFASFLILGFLLVPVVTFFGSYFAHVPFVIIGADDRVSELGTIYLFVLAFSFGAMLINQIVFSAFSAKTDVKTPMKIKIALSFVNVALSYMLIFGKFGLPAMGVAGAALGTVITLWIESFIYIYLIYKHQNPLRFERIFDKLLLIRGLKIGIPAGFERLLIYGSFLIFTRIIADFGTTIMAGYQIGLRIEGLVFMPGIGFTIAAMTLTARALGANDPNEAQKDALFTAFSSAVFMGIAGAILFFYSRYIVGFFTTDDQVIAEGILYLKIVALSQVPLGVAFVLSGAFRGAGASRTSLKINVSSMWFFRIIPAIFASIYFENILIIWLVLLVETWIRAIWLLTIFAKGEWKSEKV